jgi:hypothetical protein
MPAPDRIILYRITHYKNLAFILNNGLHSANSSILDPNFINIGNRDIIQKRRRRNVPVAPGGEIHDYVPFYFCPRSPMLGSIHVGKSDFDGSQEEIVYLVTDFQHIEDHQCKYVFTDGHALQFISNFFNHSDNFSKLDWEVIQSNDWARREDDNDRMRRKMAEFLVKDEVPLDALGCIAVFDEKMQQKVEQTVQKCESRLPVIIKRSWYF